MNTDSIRQAIDPIERGDIATSRERLEAAEHELRRLARDIADVQDDPKAVAGRLVQRQWVLNRDIELALSSVAGKQLSPDDKAAFAARLKPLAERQRTIAELAKTIKPPAGKEGQARFPHDAARDAAAKADRAAQTLHGENTHQIEEGKNQARGARAPGERAARPVAQARADAAEIRRGAADVARGCRGGRPPPARDQPAAGPSGDDRGCRGRAGRAAGRHGRQASAGCGGA